MRRIQSDDHAAFGLLYDRYCHTAFGLARSICGDSSQADYALCDGFRAAWEHRASYEPDRGSPRSWLLALIRQRSLAVGPSIHPHHRSLPSSLKDLAPLRREVIMLAYFAGLSHRQIAERLHLPSTTIKDEMRLGLRALSRAAEPRPEQVSEGIGT